MMLLFFLKINPTNVHSNGTGITHKKLNNHYLFSQNNPLQIKLQTVLF